MFCKWKRFYILVTSARSSSLFSVYLAYDILANSGVNPKEFKLCYCLLPFLCQDMINYLASFPGRTGICSASFGEFLGSFLSCSLLFSFSHRKPVFSSSYKSCSGERCQLEDFHLWKAWRIWWPQGFCHTKLLAHINISKKTKKAYVKNYNPKIFCCSKVLSTLSFLLFTVLKSSGFLWWGWKWARYPLYFRLWW